MKLDKFVETIMKDFEKNKFQGEITFELGVNKDRTVNDKSLNRVKFTIKLM